MDETPVLERSVTDDAEPDNAPSDDHAFTRPRRAPVRTARKASTLRHEPAPVADLWGDALSQQAFADLAKPAPIDEPVGISWNLAEPVIDAAAPTAGTPTAATLTSKAGITAKPAEAAQTVARSAPADDLFAGHPPVEDAPEAAHTKQRRKAAAAAAPKPRKPAVVAFSLPLDEDEHDDGDEVFDDEVFAEDAFEDDASAEVQPLGEPAPRREVNAANVRRRRKEPVSLPPGQRWKRRLPSSLR